MRGGDFIAAFARFEQAAHARDVIKLVLGFFDLVHPGTQIGRVCARILARRQRVDVFRVPARESHFKATSRANCHKRKASPSISSSLDHQ